MEDDAYTTGMPSRSQSFAAGEGPVPLSAQAGVVDATQTVALPRLHLAAYKGDVHEVLSCITDGHDVHGTVVMRNQANRLVCGITPLFLAAQRGHSKVVKLLVQHGANPGQPAYIAGSTDLCTPISVARLNLHFLVAHYLKKAVAARKKEDEVLRKEEEERIKVAANADPARGAQHVVMANLSDLSNWDPSNGEQPVLTGAHMTKLMKHNGVNLETWRPDVEVAADGTEQMVVSKSKPVDPAELEAIEATSNAKNLNKFLRDADLSAWNPEEEGGPQSATARAAPSPSVVSVTAHQVSTEVADTPSREFSRSNSRGLSRGGSPPRPAQVDLQPSLSIPRGSPVRPVVVGVRAAADFPAANTTPIHESNVRAPQTRYQQSSRSSAAAAAAMMARAAPVQAKPKPAASASTRWYAHGGSDSDSEGEEDLQVSGSRPAAPPPGVMV